MCRQSYCSTCAPRDRESNQVHRICVICQAISNGSMNHEQLSGLKVKHLRNYLTAKRIDHQTCTEKKELVDLVLSHRNVPFSIGSLSNPTASNASSSQHSSSTSGLSNFQHTISSFADQVNNLASNLSTTVSGVINQALGDDLPTRTSSSAVPSPPPPPPTNPTFQPRSTSQPPRPPPPTATTTSTSSHPRPRRKSLSEVTSEENIEDLNIRELKEILAANFVDYKGCVEKNELLERVRRLYRDRQNEKQRGRHHFLSQRCPFLHCVTASL